MSTAANTSAAVPLSNADLIAEFEAIDGGAETRRHHEIDEASIVLEVMARMMSGAIPRRPWIRRNAEGTEQARYDCLSIAEFNCITGDTIIVDASPAWERRAA